jgi:hypothetical protein
MSFHDIGYLLRIVIANTEVLHDKINQLANRVRQLEDALAAAHAMNTLEPHPLLQGDLLSIKNPLELDKSQLEKLPAKEEEPDDTLDALGSLCADLRIHTLLFGNLISEIQIYK